MPPGLCGETRVYSGAVDFDRADVRLARRIERCDVGWLLLRRVDVADGSNEHFVPLDLYEQDVTLGRPAPRMRFRQVVWLSRAKRAGIA